MTMMPPSRLPPSRRRSGYYPSTLLLALLHVLAILFSRPGACRALRTAAAWSPPPPPAAAGKTPIGRVPSPLARSSRSPFRSRRIQPLAAIDEERCCGGIIPAAGVNVAFVRGSGLFPRRETRGSRGGGALSMVADDGDASGGDEVSNGDGRPLVGVWLSIRKLLARFWSLLLKPFRLLKSLLTKVDKDGDSTEGTGGSGEPIQEGVAITMVENIAATEEGEKESVEIESTNLDEETDSKEPDHEEVAAMVVDDTPVTEEEEKESAEVDSSADGVDAERIMVNQQAIAESEPESARPRQATASVNVDLTGNWTLIVDDSFTSQYDEYLRKLGQPMLVRTVALTVIGSTKEETVQTDGGQRLNIRGTNVRGSWERTLEASEWSDGGGGDDGESHAVEGHVLRPMTTADGEDVEVASWWESGGDVHRSWVVGGEKYGGGDFENKRYLTDNGNILVCESTFHPRKEGREKACVTWRFLREGAIYGDAEFHLPNIFDVLKKDEKESNEKDDDALPKVIVGDIMDNIATSSDEADYKSSSTPDDSSVAAINTDMIEEAIERENWVPPSGDRWAISAPGVDLSGKWKLIITDKFKKEYDEFLQSLGQPLIVRGAAVVLVGNTREETKQSDGGRTLDIKGVNAKGNWERTLRSSGSDYDTTMLPNVDGSYDHARVPIVTADGERVEAESWWESDGTVHVLWTHRVKMYGGGSFESKRYLESDGNVYVCESTFYPDSKGKEKSFLKWKFLRQGAAFMPDQ